MSRPRKARTTAAGKGFTFAEGMEKLEGFRLDSFEVNRVVNAVNHQEDSLRLLPRDFAHSGLFAALRDRVTCHLTFGVVFPDRNEQIVYGVAQAEQMNVGLQSELWIWVRSQHISRD